jgi:hypothetical protein
MNHHFLIAIRALFSDFVAFIGQPSYAVPSIVIASPRRRSIFANRT